jgi:hypothetical protein
VNIEHRTSNIEHRQQIVEAALITIIPNSFKLLKMFFDAAVVGACLRIARLINIMLVIDTAMVILIILV